MNRSSWLKIALAVIVVFILYRFFSNQSSSRKSTTSYATMKGTMKPQPYLERYTDEMTPQAYRGLNPGDVVSREAVTQAPLPPKEDQVPTSMPLAKSVDLLPKPQVQNTPGAMGWDDFAPHHLQQQQLLDPIKFVGVDTQGSSLRNASHDIRRDPPIPRIDNVSPFLNSSIDPDPYKKPLDDCS